MPRRISRTGQFKKDYARAQKQGQDIDTLDEVLRSIVAGKTLDRKFRDHLLKGNYAGTRECHVGPDFLLVYRVDPKEDTVEFIRLGSHAELFR
jgi:mRNA interferase YafQ